MANNLTIQVDPKDLEKLFRKTGAIGADALGKGIIAGAEVIRSWIVNNRLSGPKPAYLGVGEVNGGRLRTSIHAFGFFQDKQNTSIRIGTNLIYARIHEYGGVIKAKNAPYLWFKIHTSDRFMSLRGNKRLAKPVAGWTWIRTKQVTIPARPFLRPATESPEVREEVSRVINKKITEAIEKA